MCKFKKIKFRKVQIEENKTIVISSILIAIFGIFLVLIKLLCVSTSAKDNITDIIWALIELIGLTIFTSSLFTLLMQTKDWTKYFEERLTKIVMNQNYLDNLNSDELQKLQVKTIKAFYKNDKLDKEGSFLNYFQENLANFIKEPYRDSVKSEICIEKVEDDGIWVYDHLTYRCRMVGDKIQDSVKWLTDKGEYTDFLGLDIKIKDNSNTVTSLIKVEKDKSQFIIEKYKVEQPEKCKLDSLFGRYFELSLDDFNEDNLLVDIESRYKVNKGNFTTWVMAHPTRGIYFTIKYPEQLTIHFQTMLLHREAIQINSQKGFFSMQYDEWLLPNSGIVYSFSCDA